MSHPKHRWVITFLAMCSVVIGVAVFLSFFAPAAWQLELLTHFRLQYSLILLCIFTIWLFLKRLIPALMIGLVLLMNTVLIVPFFLPTNWQATAMSQSSTHALTSYRVLFSNFNYGNTHFDRLTELVNQTQPTILITVEMPTDHYETLKQLLPNYPYTFHVKRGERLGTAIFSTQPFVQEPTVFFDTTQTYPTVKFQMPSVDSLQSATFYVIHPPPPITANAAQARNDLFAQVGTVIAQESGSVALFGDFNSTSWSPNFHTLIESSQLKDSRVTRGVQASWPSFLPGIMRIPIDHVLTSSQVVVESREIQPSVGSDHLPVLVDLRM